MSTFEVKVCYDLFESEYYTYKILGFDDKTAFKLIEGDIKEVFKSWKEEMEGKAK